MTRRRFHGFWFRLLRGGVAALVACALAAAAQTTVTLNPANDAYVNDSGPNTVFNNTWLVVGRSPAEFTPRYRSFLRFNLGGIPTDATITSAVLHLKLQSLEGGTSAPIELRRVLASWTSASLTWNSQPAFTAPVTITTVGSTIGADYLWSILSLVQSWVSGQYVNDGLALTIANEASATATRTFASDNHATTSLRPELVVTYALPPDINVAPTSLTFGNQPVGTISSAQTVTVQNVGGSDLNVSNVTSSSANFTITVPGGLPATVNANSNLTLQVRFAPTSPGPKNATVTITSNDPDEPTRTVSCSGTGTAPDISVAPASLPFGNQLLNTLSSPQALTVSNAGNATLTVNAITTSSTVEFPLSGLPSLPTNLPPGAEFSFQVRFKPANLGPRAATVSITSTDPDEPSVSVPCGGAGVVPDIKVGPTALNFGNQAVNTSSAPQSVVVSNTGTAMLTVNSVSSSSTEFLLNNVPSLPVSLPPGASFGFEVRFLPAGVGSRSGTVSINSSDPDEPSVSIACGGTGVGPRLAVTPSLISFGTVTLGTTARRPLALQNLGNTNLVITAITSTIPVFVVENVPPLPLTLAQGQMHTLSVDYTPPSVQTASGSVRVDSNDPITPGVVIPVGGNSAAPVVIGCGQAPVDGVMPLITSPLPDSTHLLGNPITFQAANAPNAPVLCNANCYELCWYFRKVPDQQWADVVGYQFTTGRLLGCDQAMPLPGDYEVIVSMCGVTSAPIVFHVVLAPGITDPSQLHPVFSNLCQIDWTNTVNPNRLSTAHFNVIWTTNRYNKGDSCNAPSGGSINNRPTDLRLGLVECAWATLDRWMTSPLDDSALFQDVAEYSGLTNLTWWVGGLGGGGTSQPLGFGYEQSARTYTNSRIPVHEMFHTWDYAGNPLHNKSRFDRRSQGNPYVFFHEAPARVAQTLATNAPTMYGYKTDRWPVWTPVDVGLIELGYDGGLFWSFVLSNYPFTPRLSWEGPSICACAQWAEPGRLPHNFELFELWNARVRDRIRAVVGPNPPLTSYDDCGAEHWPASSNKFFIYNGHTNPVCYQTLEYELAVLEDLIRERFPYHGTPLAESLLLDFAVNFATNFPPSSLRTQMPPVLSCINQTGINFSYGFAAQGQPDALVCDGVAGFNTNDFYARIRFRILDDSIRYLRLTANDEATLYMGRRAVIEPADSAHPNASTTYADQRNDDDAGLDYVWAGTAQPRSSVFAVSSILDRVFEIEWVNRGDGKGNSDYDTNGVGISRYSLLLESCDSLDETNATCAPIPAGQIEILSADFWPNQGSGEPGFAQPPTWDGSDSPLHREIQLRPVAAGERPFFLPPLGVHYHPVQGSPDHPGSFNVTVRHDGLTHTRPSAHLLVLTPSGIEWRGPLEQIDDDTQRVLLHSCGDGGPATFDGHPALILVVARRTFHGATNGPATNGTLGAIHYTVGVPSFPAVTLDPDRYDVAPLGNPPNNTLANATLLPNVAGGDIFTGPGLPPDRIWEMLVPDLTLHDATDQDFFRLDLPDEAGDDCLDALPNCANGSRIGNGLLEIFVRGTGGAEIIAYDALGNELGRDNNYLRVGCPRESGRDPFYFAVSSRNGCRAAYSLTISYSVPDIGLWERFGNRCIPSPPGGPFDIDDFFRLINPLKVGWNEFIFGINCDPIVCQPPKDDYHFFHWGEALPLNFEFQHAADLDFAFALLDTQFRVIASANRIGTTGGAEPQAIQRLYLSYLPTGYYALRITASRFGVPYSMRAVGLPGTELIIDPTSVRLAGGEVRFSWTAEPGRRYRVQFKDRLTDASWTDVGSEIRATSLRVSFNASVADRPARFYRIVRLDL